MSQTDKDYIKSLLSAKPKSESFFFKEEVNAAGRRGAVEPKWGCGVYWTSSPAGCGIELALGSKRCRIGVSYS